MATEFCQKCKQAHPGRDCDHDEQGECAETVPVHQEVAETSTESSRMNRPGFGTGTGK